MFLLLIIFVFLFSKSSLAATSVTILSSPTSITIGESFPVSFSINTNSTSPSFHYKIVGSGVTLFTQPNESCSNTYDNCPEINIGSSGTVTETAYAKITVITGPIKILVRVAESVSHTATSSSYQDILSYVIPTATLTPTPLPTYIPTATPIPTNTPTPVPTSTNSPTPTNTSTITPTKKPTNTSTPTITPWPTDTPLPELTPNNEPLPSQEDYSVSNSPTNSPMVLSATSETNQKTFSSYIPLIFIIIGGVMLLIPLVITKIKK